MKSLRSISIHFAEEDEEEAKAMNDVDAGRDRAMVAWRRRVNSYPMIPKSDPFGGLDPNFSQEKWGRIGWGR